MGVAFLVLEIEPYLARWYLGWFPTGLCACHTRGSSITLGPIGFCADRTRNESLDNVIDTKDDAGRSETSSSIIILYESKSIERLKTAIMANTIFRVIHGESVCTPSHTRSPPTLDHHIRSILLLADSCMLHSVLQVERVLRIADTSVNTRGI